MQQEPILKCLIAVCHMETILFCKLYCLVEILCWEIVFVKDYPALVINPFSLLVGFTNADCLVDKRHRVHRLTNSLDGGCCHAERLEVVRFGLFSFTDDEKRLLDFPYTLTA